MFRRKDMKAAILAGFSQKFGKLVEQARILLFEGFPNATFEMVVQNLRPNAAQSSRNRACEAQDVNAVAVVSDHLLKCPRLSLNTTQSRDEFSFYIIRMAVRFRGTIRGIHTLYEK